MYVFTSSLLLNKITCACFGINSLITCRQAPQGEIGRSVLATTTIASISSRRYPFVKAVNKAERSAQFVKPNEAFSIFAPLIIFPSFNFNAAPTWNFEYGA